MYKGVENKTQKGYTVLAFMGEGVYNFWGVGGGGGL
jgi:hypothetical protein